MASAWSNRSAFLKPMASAWSNMFALSVFVVICLYGRLLTMLFNCIVYLLNYMLVAVKYVFNYIGYLLAYMLVAVEYVYNHIGYLLSYMLVAGEYVFNYIGYLLTYMLNAVEYVLFVVETFPIYVLESVVYFLESELSGFQRHTYIAVLCIITYIGLHVINVLYKSYLIRMSEPKHSQCSICMERPIQVALRPCGHAQFCESCAAFLMSTFKPCPVCRKRISERLKVFI